MKKKTVRLYDFDGASVVRIDTNRSITINMTCVNAVLGIFSIVFNHTIGRYKIKFTKADWHNYELKFQQIIYEHGAKCTIKYLFIYY